MDKLSHSENNAGDYIISNIVEDIRDLAYVNEKFKTNSFEYNMFDINEIARIREYLENPIKKGVWFLNFSWTDEGGISSDIEYEIENFLSNKSTHKVSRNNKNNRIPRAISRLFSNEEELLELRRNISFFFDFFTYIYLRETEETKHQIDIEDSIDESYLQIIQVLDIDKIKDKYQAAYEIFKNEIYPDNLDIILERDNLFKIKDGVIVQNQKDNDNFSFSSLSYSPLEKLKDFLEKIGKIKDVRLRPEYSPEEIVFTPYFSFLKIFYPYFIHDSKVYDYFKQAIREFKFENYDYCISTLGLIAENYLTQIYETFHREAIPRKSTLGQTYDLINNRINNHFQTKVVPAPNINLLYERLNSFLSEKSKTDGIKYNQETINFIRELINFIQEDKKHTIFLIDNISKKESRISLFPEYLQENINELIRHRNAIAHNSRIPIGKYEAQRMVYCCITLIMWWNKEKDEINWKNDQKTIIEDTIKRSKSSSRKS